MITFEYTDIRFRESLRGAPPDGEAVGLPGGLAQARHVAAHGGFAQLVAAQTELAVHGARAAGQGAAGGLRSEEHTSELQSLMRISYAVFCLKKTKTQLQTNFNR